MIKNKNFKRNLHIDDLVKDANNGDAISQNNLGFNYLYGINGYSKKS